jgi:hypothetical protein
MWPARGSRNNDRGDANTKDEKFERRDTKINLYKNEIKKE